MFSARDPLSPPLDFPLVGLAGSWDHRWVEFFEGELGSAVWSVLLGHLNLESLIIVRTAPRERWNRLQGGGIEDTGLGAFVDGAVIMLVDMARVDGMDERTRYNRGLVTYASNQAKNWRQWESEVWHWNSEPVSARTFSFAHAWLGVSLDDPDRYISVVAFNTPSRVVDLVDVDADSYDFDFTRPFGIEDLQERVDRHPVVWSLMRSPQLTADHIQVINTKPVGVVFGTGSS
jgi:hypothetical protein